MAFRAAAARARQVGTSGITNVLAGVESAYDKGVDYEVDDHLQGYAEQGQVTHSYVADNMAYKRRMAWLDRNKNVRNLVKMPLGSPDDFDIRPHDLVFTDAEAQIEPVSGNRHHTGWRPICKTYVHAVLNGLENQCPGINFQGVAVAGKDAERDVVSNVTDVTVQTAGSTYIRNIGPSKKTGDKLYWTYPIIRDGKPRFRSQQDIMDGRVRILPEVHTIACMDVAVMKCGIILESDKAKASGVDVHEFVKAVRAKYCLTAYRDEDTKEEAARDPVSALAALVFEGPTLKAGTAGRMYYTEDVFRSFPVINKSRKRKAQQLVALPSQGSNNYALLMVMATERVRAEIGRRFIGTCRQAAAPGATLEILLKQ